MINVIVIYFILIIHWLADFVFQTNWQQKNKHKNFKALLAHTAVYSLILYVPMQILQEVGYFGAQYWYASLLFALIQFVTHTAIDAIASRINTILWNNKQVHEFFVSIGFDQFLHLCILFGSFNLVYYG